MKAFNFRLDQVMRWRATQLELEKTQVARVSSKLAGLRQAAESLRSELTEGAIALSTGGTGADFGAWDTYAARTRRRIDALVAETKTVESELATQMRALIAADRNLRLLSNLKAGQHERWLADWNRELESFAAESFLGRLQLKQRSGA